MGITSADKSKATEALNRHPNLSPAARRVGLELLNRIDRKTGLAWPSEARMAETLGVNVRTIRRGKAELHALGLVTWVRRGTSRKGRTPLYTITWAVLLTIADTIKAKVKAACDAARVRTSGASKPSSVEKQSTEIITPLPDRLPVQSPQITPPRPAVGRTFSPSYLSQYLNKASGSGFWKAPGTPQGQVLTDQQLDGKAQARIYDALKALGHAAMMQFFNHPDAAQLEADAIKAERFSPDQGRTGLAIIAIRINNTVTA